MKKHLLVLLTVIVLSLTLVSCEGIFGGGQTPGGGGDTPPSAGTENVKYNTIVTDYEGFDFIEITNKIRDLFGPVQLVGTADSTPKKGEIVFGVSNRDITKKAKQALETELAASSRFDTGYIIYAEGGSIAVYWMNDGMAEIAFANFITECIDKSKLVVSDGIIFKELYDERDFNNDKAWLELEAKHDPELVEAIRKLYNFYDGPNIAGWLANLYDPEVGGFYYCNSARDYATFLPDLESTSQALGLISALGAFQGVSMDDVFPVEVKKSLVEFARKMQSPIDGYFYNPQWPQGKENLATDRYGRDQGSAINIINRFTYDDDGDGIPDKQYPTYCGVEGKCEEHAVNGGSCNFPQAASYYADTIAPNKAVTVALKSSTRMAVSRVQSVAAVSDHPDYSSAKAFSDWLEAYNANMFERSGHAHQLAALVEEIIRHGYQNILIAHLDRKQIELFEEMEAQGEEPTGAWQRNIDYQLVWGAYKHAHIYNTVGAPMNLEYVPYLVKSCIKVIMLPAIGNYAYNDLMNMWSAITSLNSNITKFYSAEAAKQIYDIVREDPISLIENTIKKVQPFKMEDGSMSNNVNGTTSASIYGTPIAMGGMREGNVNSTAIVRNIYAGVCGCMGVKAIPLCTIEDGKTFVETISTLEPIDKITVKADMHDFEKPLIGNSITSSANNAGFVMETAPDPVFTDNALYFVSPSGASSGDAINFTVSGMGSSCYVFDTEIYVKSDSTNSGTLLQLKMGPTVYMLELRRSGDTLKLWENTHITSGKSYEVKGTNLKVDTWFRLRVEYYTVCEENGIDVPMIKIFVDENLDDNKEGKLVAVTSNFYNSHNVGASPNTNYAKVEILSLRSPSTYIYLDNCAFIKEENYYDADDDEMPVISEE